jgi:GTPase SAR1 family protein
MKWAALAHQLQGIVNGDPEFTLGKDPILLKENAIVLVGQLLREIGFNDVTDAKQSKARVFDLLVQLETMRVAIELRFGHVSDYDLQRAATLLGAAEGYVDKLMIVSKSVSDNARRMILEGGLVGKIFIVTFNEFCSLFIDESVSSVEDFIQALKASTPLSIKSDIIDDQIRSYLTSTFGNEFWNQISKSDVAMDIFRYTKGVLGTTDATIILCGTTHTGKSSIANTLFGTKVIDTAPYTDVSGQVTVIMLQSGLRVIDTPGVGGLNDKYENITRLFLGLPLNNDMEHVNETPIIDLSNPENPQLIKEWKLDPLKNVVLIMVFDLIGGFKKADLDFLILLKSRFSHIMLVGNKLDLFPDVKVIDTVKEDLKRRVSVDFVAIAAKPEKNAPPIGIDSLVRGICYQLSENAISTFNQELVLQHQRKRDHLIDEAIRRVAARAAVVRAEDSIPGTNIPLHKALLTGLLMRLGIDYNVGGDAVRKEVNQAVRSVLLHIAESTTKKEIHIEKKGKKVRRWKDQAVGSASAGSVIGGIIGFIFGGPLGALFGSALGGTVGGIAGSAHRIYDIVNEIWDVPEEERREYPGGSSAALATLAFGRVIWNSFIQMERTGRTEIDMSNLMTELNHTIEMISKRITPDQIKILNDTIDENVAYKILLEV